MAQTLSDLVTSALSNDFDRTTYQSAAQQAVLDGAADIVNTITVPQAVTSTTLNVVNGVAAIVLPSTLRRIDSLTDSDGNSLTEVSTDWLDQNPFDRGAPTAFALSDNQLYVWPTPNGNDTLTLRYINAFDVSTLTDLSPMASSTGIPEEYLRALVSFARARLFALEDDPDMATFWRSEYDRDIGRMKADVQFRSRGRRQRRSIWTKQAAPAFRLP